MSSRTFTPDQLEEIGLPYEADGEDGRATELHSEQVDTRRWVSVHALIFRAPDDGKTYRIHFTQGLTEHQDGTDPWNGDHTVTATEVALRPVTVQRWQNAAEQPADADADPWQTIARLTSWLDDRNGRSGAETALRLLKVTEETGEVAQAWIGVTGQNPRKGVTHTVDDVAAELCDVIVAAMVALTTLLADPAAHFDRKLAGIAALRLDTPGGDA